MGITLAELSVPIIRELIVRSTPDSIEPMVQTYRADERLPFAARLRQAMRDAGYPERGGAVRLGRELGISERAVGKWLNGDSMPDTKRLNAISMLLSASAEWLLTGREARAAAVENAEPGPPVRGVVPVISWVQAGTWAEAIEHDEPDEWIPCPASHGPRTYALRVRGDSMTSPHGKSYPDGCLVFVDPDRRSPASGQPVIAKVNGDAQVTFKIFTRDAGRTWLRALNPAFPPITDEFRIIGTVIGKWEDA